MAAVKSPEHAALGRVLRETRLRRGLSQEELGFQSGLHRNYGGSCERGEINLSFGVLVQLTHALDVSLAQLLLPSGK